MCETAVGNFVVVSAPPVPSAAAAAAATTAQHSSNGVVTPAHRRPSCPQFRRRRAGGWVAKKEKCSRSRCSSEPKTAGQLVYNYYRTVANVKQIIFFEGLPSPARQLPHLPRKLSAATRGCTATTSTAPRQSIGAGLFQAPPVQGYKVSSALHKHPSAKSGQLARFRLLKSGV